MIAAVLFMFTAMGVLKVTSMENGTVTPPFAKSTDADSDMFASAFLTTNRLSHKTLNRCVNWRFLMEYTSSLAMFANITSSALSCAPLVCVSNTIKSRKVSSSIGVADASTSNDSTFPLTCAEVMMSFLPSL